jgi:hypothetical protein
MLQNIHVLVISMLQNIHALAISMLQNIHALAIRMLQNIHALAISILQNIHVLVISIFQNIHVLIISILQNIHVLVISTFQGMIMGEGLLIKTFISSCLQNNFFLISIWGCWGAAHQPRLGPRRVTIRIFNFITTSNRHMTLKVA